MREKTVVVGAGIAGITAAYFEASKGHDVVLLESDPRPGGLLKSDFNGNHYFDYGTHIFSDTGIGELDQFLFSGLNQRNCMISKTIATGNYFRGEMNHKNNYVDTSILPVRDFNQGCMELLSAVENKETENLQDYFKTRVGDTFYNLIFKDVVKKYMGEEPQNLSTKVGKFFDMNRVLAFDDATTKLLGEINTYNDRLGHHTRKEGANKYYPKEGGTGKIITLLMDQLQQKNVDFRPSTRISAVSEKQGRVDSITTENETIKIHKLVWTLPVGFLIRLTGSHQVAFSPLLYRNSGLFDFVFEKPINSKATFINIYDTTLLSGRLTLYQNLAHPDNYSCTVEVLADNNIDLSVMTGHILHELVKMGLVEYDHCEFKQFRTINSGFPVLTTDFVNKQSQLETLGKNYFHNVMFVGRSTKVFFMAEILKDVYSKITCQ